jgi:hypothetical protein
MMERKKQREGNRSYVLCLPYVKGLSEKIEKECKVIEPEKLKLAFRPNRTMSRTLVQVKNKIPPEKKKGVVYEVQCHDCDDMCG